MSLAALLAAARAEAQSPSPLTAVPTASAPVEFSAPQAMPLPTATPIALPPVDPFAVPGAPPAAPLPYPSTGAEAAAVPGPASIVAFDPAVTPASASSPAPPEPPSGVAAEPALPRLASLEQRVNNYLQSTTGATYPTIKINGVFQIDSGWVSQDSSSVARYGVIRDGVDFRRARLAASGAITEVNNYFLQMDFAFFGRPTFTDLWVEQTDVPLLGNIRVGQWKQPFSLEVVSSFRYTTFAERSLVFQPFTPFRHIGVGFYDRNDAQTMTWAASAFAAGNDQFGGSITNQGGIGTAERITWLPHYDEPSGGRYYMHLGAGHYFSAPDNKTVNFRTVPELYIGQYQSSQSGPNQQPTPTLTTGMPFFVATGNMSVYNYNVLGSELLWVRGPLSLQSEWMLNCVNQTVGDDVYFTGGYATLGYFLTGEHRPYDRKTGAIDRIKPFENFFRVKSKDGGVCRGMGAWEVAGRVSTINLKGNYVATPASTFPGELVGGGVVTDLTLGLNWYMTPYTKAQFNYIHSHSTDAASNVALTHLFDLRFQADF